MAHAHRSVEPLGADWEPSFECRSIHIVCNSRQRCLGSRFGSSISRQWLATARRHVSGGGKPTSGKMVFRHRCADKSHPGLVSSVRQGRRGRRRTLAVLALALFTLAPAHHDPVGSHFYRSRVERDGEEGVPFHLGHGRTAGAVGQRGSTGLVARRLRRSAWRGRISVHEDLLVGARVEAECPLVAPVDDEVRPTGEDATRWATMTASDRRASCGGRHGTSGQYFERAEADSLVWPRRLPTNGRRYRSRARSR
jgi:hypothetical protein